MNNVRTIAVGFDGSQDSMAALRWTLAFAKDAAAEVVVIHAVGMVEHQRSPFARDVTPPIIISVARELGFEVRRLHWRVSDGDACSVLLRASAPPLVADLVVVGSRGSGKRAGMLIGSTSLEVAEHSSVPVVIVPSNYTTRAEGSPGSGVSDRSFGA
jgi:nucleotide-binding universal stress UspA family protein